MGVCLEWTPFKHSKMYAVKPSLSKHMTPTFRIPSAISFEGHRRQFVDFLDAIENDREPLVNGEEGRKAVEIILAIYQASETERAVKLPL